MANDNWVKTKNGMRQFLPMIGVSTVIIAIYAIAVRIFFVKGG